MINSNERKVNGACGVQTGNGCISVVGFNSPKTQHNHRESYIQVISRGPGREPGGSLYTLKRLSLPLYLFISLLSSLNSITSDSSRHLSLLLLSLFLSHSSVLSALLLS
jgi:hypothetical protein